MNIPGLMYLKNIAYTLPVRPRYQVMKEDVLRSGDTLIITELDRLGRDKRATMKELQYYKDNGIRVMILELPTTCQDFSKLDNEMASMLMETINNMLVELYAAIAESELKKKEKRQREGIAKKKDRGEWEDYGRPRVLNIDEATSSLDNAAQENIIDLIFSLLKNRTVIIIAHRLSAVKRCDNIIVINNGRVTESGNHNELMEMQGEYYALYNAEI